MLALKPKYLVLDEPTAMLDPMDKKDFVQVIKNLQEREKIAIVYTTNVIDRKSVV